MKTFKALIFVLTIAIILPGAAVSAESSAVAMLIQKAHSLEGRGRYDLAAQTWQQVLVVDPNQPDALASLARLAERVGKSEEAATYVNRLKRSIRATRLSPRLKHSSRPWMNILVSKKR
jgi:hypothetical protein